MFPLLHAQGIQACQMAKGRKGPFPRRVAKELSIGFGGRATVQCAEPEAARTRHTELSAHRIPSMRRTDAHTQIAPQEGCRQRARPVLRTRDLIRMTRVQVSGGKSACQRNRSTRKRAAQLIRIPVESVGKEK